MDSLVWDIRYAVRIDEGAEKGQIAVGVVFTD
jgi:hypothetical protein